MLCLCDVKQQMHNVFGFNAFERGCDFDNSLDYNQEKPRRTIIRPFKELSLFKQYSFIYLLYKIHTFNKINQ